VLPFRRILFPVDYSDRCRALVPYVRDMAGQFAAELTLLHAYGPEALAFSELPIVDPNLLEEARAAEKERLRTFALENFPGGKVETALEQGDAAHAIEAFVRRQGTDLVMLPTHGRGPLRRFLLGSVTAKVLHDVSAAVWTGVGAAIGEHQPHLPYKSMVCALDETEESEAVLKGAAALAESYGAKLMLVHVVETPPMSVEIDFAPYKKDLMDAADMGLRALKARAGVEAPHSIVDGRIADGVRQAAIENKADLVIAGRGLSQGVLSRVWSKLYSIVRESPCPVLSI
jgi:nucleotide-binding universal stress UspA family protein